MLNRARKYCGMYYTKFECILKATLMILTSVPRALRATTQSVVLLQSRSAGNAKYNADSVLRSNFTGGRIRKTESNFLKFGGNSDLVSAPQEGAGGMRGGFFSEFFGAPI